MGFMVIISYSLWKAGFFLSDPSLFMAGTARFRSAESDSFILVGENSLPPSNILPYRFSTLTHNCRNNLCSNNCNVALLHSYTALPLRFVYVPQGQREGNCTLHSLRINPRAAETKGTLFDLTLSCGASSHHYYFCSCAVQRMRLEPTITEYGAFLIHLETCHKVAAFKSSYSGAVAVVLAQQ